MELLSALKRSRPFIYLVNGKYYLISSKTFRECVGEDGIFAKGFVEEANNLNKLHKCMTLLKKDMEKYNTLYNEVVKRDELTTQTPAEVAHEIEKLLCLNKNNEEEIASLRQQHENFEKLSWLQDELKCFGSVEKGTRD